MLLAERTGRGRDIPKPSREPAAVTTSHPPDESDYAAQFRSILSPGSTPHGLAESVPEPEFFSDLNLDQIVASVTAGYEQYRLQPFFCEPPGDQDTIHYRQQVFRDLQIPAIAAHIHLFAKNMESMRQRLAEASKRYYPRQKQWGLVWAIDGYCSAVDGLARELRRAPATSDGLKKFTKYLTAYWESEAYRSLVKETGQLKADLSHVSYRLYLHHNRIEVSRDTVEPDYSAEVEETFAKFRQHEAREYLFELPDSPDINHVEAAVLDLVARLHPTVFQSLDGYCDRHRDYLNEVISAFDREVHFYLAYLDHIQSLEQSGLPFCYPELSSQSKAVECRDTFDLALAARLSKNAHRIVLNDLRLEDQERVIVVSGANQGGKTTFARLFGQLHYLGRLGCPVPGRLARLFYFDRMFTHFEREEDIRTLRSKLEDDLTRIHRILEQATSNSLLIMNESFSSATLEDALLLSREVMRRIVAKDLICVFVTFLDELASFGCTTVSMTSMVDPQDVTRRTFKVIRRPADGLAYAMALAEKYGLTYEGVMRRVSA